MDNVIMNDVVVQDVIDEDSQILTLADGYQTGIIDKEEKLEYHDIAFQNLTPFLNDFNFH